MRELLKIQEGMDFRLNQRDEELHQLWSQSQSDGAQLAALSLQMQELTSLVESRAKVVGKDLEEINGQFDCHRGEINRLKIREKDSKQEVEQLKGFVIGAGQTSSLTLTTTYSIGIQVGRIALKKYLALATLSAVPNYDKNSPNP